MKTTIEVADPLLREAREVAEREGKTLRSLLEEGLRKVLDERRQRRRRFRLRSASFRGEGLQPGVGEGSWTAIRDRIYEGRGS